MSMSIAQLLDRPRSHLSIALIYSCLSLIDGKQHSIKKNILIWNPPDSNNCDPFDSLGTGNDVFEAKKCSFTNCFIHKNYEKLTAVSNLSRYDAIMFDGRLINALRPRQLPRNRKPQQLFIFVQQDSAANHPVCKKYYDNFFNMTITYRLDSDIIWTYFKIKTFGNKVVGPKANMNWMELDEMQDVNEVLRKKLQQKSRLACFISDCHSRDNVWMVKYLNEKLMRITDKKVDTLYDTCKPLRCQRNESTTYHSLMERYHHFFMAVENSMDKDFVTNKLLTALLHDTVPIVYGGADYRNFAPPGSYVDVSMMVPRKLPYYMMDLLDNQSKYYEFFKWRNHYYYEKTLDLSSVACELCEKLNAESTHKSYKRFRSWWNEKYLKKCKPHNIDHEADGDKIASFNSNTSIEYEKSEPEIKFQKLRNKSSKKLLYTEKKSLKRIKNGRKFIDGKHPIYILLWARPNCEGCKPFNKLKTGNTAFKENSCEYTNCYIHYKGHYQSKDYDAIIFNGRPIIRLGQKQLPPNRRQSQVYIFLSLESPDRFPICHDYYDNFFNWTITYRLDSDLPWTYFEVTTLDSLKVAPKEDPVQWIGFENMHNIDSGLKAELAEKNKLATWFVSNCVGVKSGRKSFVHKLNNELVRFGVDPVDVYGRCGPKKCPKDEPNKCNGLIKEYLFYMALENAISKDYVTEKVLLGYQNNAIPVVLGGADYDRFLPPGSYLNGYMLGPKLLAQTMVAIAKNRSSYYQFFKWRNHYTFIESWPICQLCAKLNGHKETKTYKNFRYWWNKNWWMTCLDTGKIFKSL